MRIAVASDHAGFKLKQDLAEHVRKAGHEVVDLGPATPDPVDYPDFALDLARRVAAGEVDTGVLCCGSGTGMAIAANKVTGVRAAACTNEFLARMARAHNDANVLCLGERVVGLGLARSIVDTFLTTPFEAGRHATRLQKIE